MELTFLEKSNVATTELKPLLASNLLEVRKG